MDCEEDSLRDVARVAYADMLLDHERNVKYQEAIVKTIQRLEKEGKDKIRVIDIGAGTGLLSMMAARLGSHVTVKAFEAETPVSRCASEIVKSNGLSDQIQVINMRGEEGRLQEEDRADVLITELFDTELIGEAALLVYRSALKHLMKNPCQAVPSKARIWIQPVKSRFLSRHNQLLPGMQVNFRDKRLSLSVPRDFISCPGSGILHDIQVNQLRPGQDFDFLSDPQVAFEFDFTREEGLPLMDEKRLSFPLNLKLQDSSNICIFFWWDLIMDSEEEVILSMAPSFPSSCEEDLKTNWREHWIQAVYYLPMKCLSGEEKSLEIVAEHDEFSFKFSWTSEVEGKRSNDGCSCGHHTHISRSRMNLWNDCLHWKSLINAIPLDLKEETKFVYLGDTSLLPIFVALAFKSNAVLCVTEQTSTRNFFKEFASCNNLSNLSIESTFPSGDEADTFVLLEPFCFSSDVPANSLSLWSEIPASIPDERSLINRIRISVIPVQFNHLWKTCASVRNVCEFDISSFDDMIQSAIKSIDPTVESYPLWEYPCKCLTDHPVVAFDVYRKDYVKNQVLSFNHSFQMDCKRLDISLNHVAFCFWSEFLRNDQVIWSTGLVEDVKEGMFVSWRRDCRQLVSWCFINDKSSQDKLPKEILIDVQLFLRSFELQVSPHFKK